MDDPPFHILSEEPESEISTQQSEEDDSVVPRICIQDAINTSTKLLEFAMQLLNKIQFKFTVSKKSS